MFRYYSILIYASLPLYASQRIVTLNGQPTDGQRIITLNQNPSLYKGPKAYKQAFLHHNPRKVEELTKQQHPRYRKRSKKEYKQRQALLAITARTINPNIRKQLFKTGIQKKLFTKKDASKAAQAMQKHAQQLQELVQSTCARRRNRYS